MLMDKGEIVIKGKRIKIRNKVHYFDFSAHAGRSDLYRFVKESSPQSVICVHGDSNNTSDFSENLKLEGFDSYAPKVGDKIRIS